MKIVKKECLSENEHFRVTTDNEIRATFTTFRSIWKNDKLDVGDDVDLDVGDEVYIERIDDDYFLVSLDHQHKAAKILKEDTYYFAMRKIRYKEYIR